MADESELRLPGNRSYMKGCGLIRMKIGLSLAVLVSCVCLIACGSSKKQVSGQIFVVLENRETLKLSGTPVYVISAETANKVVNDMKARRDEAVKPRYLQEMLDLFAVRSSKEIAEAKLSHNTLRLMMLSQAAPALKGTPEETANLERILAEDSAKLKNARLLATYSDSAHVVPIAKTVTDAEAKFSVPSSTAEQILFVATSRKLGETEEKYCWLVRVPTGGTNVFLTNNNMIDTDSSENLAREAYLNAPPEPN